MMGHNGGTGFGRTGYGTQKLPFEHFLDALFWKQNEKVERFFKNDFSITVAAD